MGRLFSCNSMTEVQQVAAVLTASLHLQKLQQVELDSCVMGK